MHRWRVAGGIVETADGLLLVRNRRANGYSDWSPPGGVIDEADLDVVSGLTREVEEETGLRVSEWVGPVYTVEATALDLGWQMTAEVFCALAFSGTLRIDDPDGIVVDAGYVERRALDTYLVECAPWVREPLTAFLDERWEQPPCFRYEVRGKRRSEMRVARST